MSNMFICKAKRIDNNEWIKGRVWKVNENDKHFIFPLGCNIYDSDGVNGLIKKFDGHYYILEAVEINPKTLCYFTGVVIDNQEIYENDILFDEHREELYTVSFDEGKFIGSDSTIQFDLCDLEECVHYGNVYDNPELSEVATNES